MKPTEAAKAFLRDAYEARHERVPSDEELLDWAIQQWSEIRKKTPAGTTPGELLRNAVADSIQFPGLKSMGVRRGR